VQDSCTASSTINSNIFQTLSRDIVKCYGCKQLRPLLGGGSFSINARQGIRSLSRDHDNPKAVA